MRPIGTVRGGPVLTLSVAFCAQSRVQGVQSQEKREQRGVGP